MRMAGNGGLRDAWLQAPSVLATPVLVGRVVGVMFVCAGLQGAFAALMIERNAWTLLLAVAALAAATVGVAVFFWGYLLSLVHYEAIVAAGACTLAMGVYLASDHATAVACASFFIYAGCASALFLPWTRSLAQIGLAVALCMVALAARPDLEWWAGVMASTATVLTGVSVGVLGRYASDANQDSLTGLLNRRGFDRALGYALAEAARFGRRPVIVLFDLDRFKWINDTHGHHAGDQLLRQVGRTWQGIADESHVLARYGGDEFALLLPEATEEEAVAVSRGLRQAISMGCSAGVTSWSPGESGSLLVGRADLALYRAKQAGGNTTVLESMRPSAVAAELRDAIDGNAVDVHYAPIVRLACNDAEHPDLVGVEAVVQWSSRTDPGITPADTIQIAEGHDLIAALDRLVLERACTELVEICRTHGPLTVHVNVSGRELAETRYVASVQDVLNRTRWPADRLVLEIQETVLDYDTPAVIRNMVALRECGIRIAIDDFGSGYSSLSRLDTLPIDLAKVHRKFVTSLATEPGSPSLLGAIAALGDAMNLPVVARGVEDARQADALARQGYRLAQGAFFGEVRPAAAFGW